MNSNDFVNVVAAEARLNKKEAAKTIEAVFTAVAKALVGGEKISVSGFGTFEVKEKEARNGINPKTKEKIVIPSRKVVVFKPAKNLKDSLN